MSQNDLRGLAFRRPAPLLIFVVSIFVCLLVACSSKPPVDNGLLPPPPPDPLEHVIRYRGETLGAISAWYTGDVKNWRAITEFNPGLDPRRLALGSRVLVPGEMVANDAPMPEHFVRRSKDSGSLEVETPMKEGADSDLDNTLAPGDELDEEETVVESPTPTASATPNVLEQPESAASTAEPTNAPIKTPVPVARPPEVVFSETPTVEPAKVPMDAGMRREYDRKKLLEELLED